MEKTQKLILDFTKTGSHEEYLSAFCGDMSSNTVELEVIPALSDGEILLCSFVRDGAAVDTLVITDGKMVIPYTVLKDAGSYTAAFAVADMKSRLTATTLLKVSVAPDRVTLAPAPGQEEDQSLITYILSQAAETATQSATAAAEQVTGELSTALDDMDNRLSAAESTVQTVQTAVSQLSDETDAVVDDLESRLSAAETNVSSALSGSAENASDIAALTETVDNLSESSQQMSENISSLTSQISSAVSDISSLEQTVEEIQNSSGSGSAGGVVIKSGSDCIMPIQSSSKCVSPVSRWIRIDNTVILSFGFYSSVYNDFTIGNLPYSCASDVVGAVLSRVDLTVGGAEYQGSFVLDACELSQGSNQIRIKRQNTEGAVLQGVLIYHTDDPA